MPDFDLDGAADAGKLLKARKRVESALALARHAATIPADREAAIAGAERIIAANGLDRASFQWPGEERPATPPPSRFRDDLFRKPRAPERYTREEMQDVWARFRAHMRSAGAEARPGAGDAFAYEAGRKRGAAGAGMDRIRTDLAVSWLWNRDPPVHVYGNAAALDGSRLWIIPSEGGREFTDAGVIEVAERHGWGREDPPNPFAGGVSGEPTGRMFVDGVEVGEIKSFRFSISNPLARLDAAVAFLKMKGHKVSRVPDSDYWSFDGELIQDRTVILAAELRGFGK